jgi:hypothetical protein
MSLRIDTASPEFQKVLMAMLTTSGLHISCGSCGGGLWFVKHDETMPHDYFECKRCGVKSDSFGMKLKSTVYWGDTLSLM